MSYPHLSVLEIAPNAKDTLVVLRAGSPEDRYFPPMLAAQLFLDIRGLIQQDCDSLPAPPRGPKRSKEGTTRASRRWAFAQEIFSNNGRGTESGHFLEHLTLEMALRVSQSKTRIALSGDTSWNFRDEPDIYRVRFQAVGPELIRPSLEMAREALARWDYQLQILP